MELNLRALAKICGCSHMTVSRALKGSPRVKPGLRKRICQAAEKLGYRPDPSVSKFMATVRKNKIGQTRASLAYFETDHSDNWKYSDYSKEVYQAIRDRAEYHGYSIDYLWLYEPEFTPERWVKVLRARGIEGIIFGVGADPALRAPTIDFPVEGFSACCGGTPLQRPLIPYAGPNYYRNFLIAAEKIDDLGYRRVGLVDTRAEEFVQQSIYQAAYLHWVQISRRPKTPFYNLDGGGMSVASWINRTKPELIIVASGGCAYEVRKACRTSQIPYLINLNWEPGDGTMGGVDHQKSLIGAANVDLVIDQIIHNKRGELRSGVQLLIDGVWRDAVQ